MSIFGAKPELYLVRDGGIICGAYDSLKAAELGASLQPGFNARGDRYRVEHWRAGDSKPRMVYHFSPKMKFQLSNGVQVHER